MDKAPQRQGPIRFEAVIPLAIVAGLIVLYFSLFFDTHLRRGLEYAATQANGAEVDVGQVRTSMWDATVRIADIQLTDPAQPTRNRVQIGEVRFGMLWDALLRGKVVIEEAVVEEVQVDTPRQRPGRVLPPSPPASGPSASDKMLAQLQDEFSGNVIGDLAAIAAGTRSSEQLRQITGELKSDAYLDGLRQSLDDTEQQWRVRMDALPDGEQLGAMRTRLAKIDPKAIKDVAQLQAALQELRSLRDEFDNAARPVVEAGNRLGSDMGTLRSAFDGLEQVTREDVRGLQARLHLPTLDTSTLSRALFGMDVLGKLQQARGYMEQARQYMPAKSAAAQPQPEQVRRSKGRDFRFGRPKGYPAFWLRRAAITSRVQGSGLGGEIRDLASDQALVGRPMVATLKGDFPQQGIAGVQAELMIDHRGSEALERVSLDVGGFPVAGRVLADSDNVKLTLADARASTHIAAELRGERIDMQLGSRFNDARFETEARSPVVREMIAASVAGLRQVGMTGHVRGTWDDLDVQLSSDLADALAKGMSRYVQARMEEARKRIAAMVEARISDKKRQLMARRDEIENRLRRAVEERRAQVDKLRSELEAARNELEKRKDAALGAQQQNLKQEANKLLDKWRR
ncbi:MAG: TIGR03545 family protein [Pseudomonadota bacterium]